MRKMEISKNYRRKQIHQVISAGSQTMRNYFPKDEAQEEADLEAYCMMKSDSLAQ